MRPASAAWRTRAAVAPVPPAAPASVCTCAKTRRARCARVSPTLSRLWSWRKPSEPEARTQLRTMTDASDPCAPSTVEMKTRPSPASRTARRSAATCAA
eukprot:scaffold12024_cov142-Isochrysis_galbana.AAC.4